MKLLVCLTFFVIFFIQLPAFSQAVDVRSGEHQGFSRLVFYFNETPERAEIVPAPGGYELLVSPTPLSIETSTVFDFIPENRITAVSRSSNGIRIDSGCECNANFFEYSERILVVDVSDAQEDEQYSSSRLDQFAGGPSAPSHFLKSIEQREPIYFSPISSFFPITALKSFASSGKRFGAGNALAELSFGLGGGVSAGLAETQRTSPFPQRNLTTDAPSMAGIFIYTQISDLKGTASFQNSTCPPLSTFSPAAWASVEEAHSNLISEARSSAYIEDGWTDDESALELIFSYLYLGFGAEASQVIATLRSTKASLKALNEIASLLDNPLKGDFSLLPDMGDCGPEAAFWALLASDDFTREIDVDAIVLELSRMPLHLRQHLAPYVSRKLELYGFEEASAIAEKTVARAIDKVSSSGFPSTENGSNFEPELRSNFSPESKRELSRQLGPEKFNYFLTAQTDSSSSLEPELATLIEAIVYEAKGSLLGFELLNNYVTLLSEGGSHAKAIRYMEDIIKSDYIDPESISSPANYAFRSLARTGTRGDIVHESLALLSSDLGSILDAGAAGEMRNALARLGFMSVASDFAKRFPFSSQADVERTSSDRPVGFQSAGALPIFSEVNVETDKKLENDEFGLSEFSVSNIRSNTRLGVNDEISTLQDGSDTLAGGNDGAAPLPNLAELSSLLQESADFRLSAATRLNSEGE